MYFVTFWCGKCQIGSVVTVQGQFERGTIIIKFLVFALEQYKLVSLTFSLPYLYSYINIQSKNLYQAYGSPIFGRINIHIQRYLHEGFNEKI
jgi:hypothetical protein